MFVRARAAMVGVAVGLLAATLACEPERPPAPETSPQAGPEAPQAADSEAYFEPGAGPAVLTFVGDKGHFADSGEVDEVPQGARGFVRVTMLEGPPPPQGMVWVTNLGTPEDDGRFRLRTVKRDLFEELALDGKSSDITVPEGLELPTRIADGPHVIVYKTSWCGVCEQLEKYLKKMNIPYVTKDIEKDRAAAAELQAKGKAQGVPTRSVPVVDVGGTLVVGFNRKRLEELL